MAWRPLRGGGGGIGIVTPTAWALKAGVAAKGRIKNEAFPAPKKVSLVLTHKGKNKGN